MSIFGDIAKAARKGLKSIQKGVPQIIRAAQPLAPILAAVPSPVTKGVAAGLTVGGALLPTQRTVQQAGRPRRTIFTPKLIATQRRFVSQVATAGARLAGGRLQPRVATQLQAIPPVATPQRQVPIQPAVQPAIQRRPPMPLRPRRPIQAQPAAFGLKVPQALTDPLGTLQRALPFDFGAGALQPQAQPIIPLSGSTDKIGRPLIVAPGQEVRVRCPPGYLAVTMPDGSRACVLAGVAVAAGLAKRRKKPLISVRETNALRVADRARGKVKRVAQRSGFTVQEKRRSTRKRS